MYNKSTETPIGHCTVNVTSPKNKSYQTEFVVLANNNCTPLLGGHSSQQIDLIKVRHKNILAVVQKEHTEPLNTDMLMQQYRDIFSGTGKIDGKYHLEIHEDAFLVVHPPRRVPVAQKPQLKDGRTGRTGNNSPHHRTYRMGLQHDDHQEAQGLAKDLPQPKRFEQSRETQSLSLAYKGGAPTRTEQS